MPIKQSKHHLEVTDAMFFIPYNENGIEQKTDGVGLTVKNCYFYTPYKGIGRRWHSIPAPFRGWIGRKFGIWIRIPVPRKVSMMYAAARWALTQDEKYRDFLERNDPENYMYRFNKDVN